MTQRHNESIVTELNGLQSGDFQDGDRNIARQKLLAAGFLVTSLPVPDNVTILSPKALLEIGRLPDWARPTSELIDEDRGSY